MAHRCSTQAIRLEELTGATGKPIHLLEVQSRQVLAAKAPSFARMRPVLSSSFADGRYRGAEGKKPLIFAVAQRENGMGFMSARLVEQVNLEQVREFAQRISPHSKARTTKFSTLRVLCESHQHEAKATSPEKVGKWLLKVHIVTSNFKSFLAGTFHDVSHQYLQGYIDEFVCRFNRQFQEQQLPDRLLQAAVDQVPIRVSLNSV